VKTGVKLNDYKGADFPPLILGESSMSTKRFKLGDVLSITTGVLLSEDRMGGVYNILNFMTGDNLFTHALPRAADVCKPVLLNQFPQLVNVESDPSWPKDGEAWEVIAVADNCGELVKTLAVTFGEWFDVEPLSEWVSRDPIAELIDMVGADKVVVAVIPDDKPT
jgi:hypothetical protein